jgi:integrase
LEQGEADRSKASALGKARLVNSDQAANRKARTRDLAMFDSKLRGCDVVALRVEDVAPNGYTLARATVSQRKTGRSVRFELTEQTREAVDDYLKAAGKVPANFSLPVGGGRARP